MASPSPPNSNNVVDFPIARNLRDQSISIADANPLANRRPPPTPPPPFNVPKFHAKRFNEQLKAAYGFLNTLGAAILLTAWIGPVIRGENLPWGLDNPILISFGVGPPLFGQFLLWKFMRPEE